MKITAQNTNDLASKTYPILSNVGLKEESRNGPVLRFPGVTVFKILKPCQRVNFCPVRDANPFFHLAEGLAMLAAVNSVTLMSNYASGMAQYSDDGVSFNAFYGTRLRERPLERSDSLRVDQLEQIITNLKRNPRSRQEVALLWESADLLKVTKDKACNLMLLFEVDQRMKSLNMTSFNRSNDLIFGFVTGANMVHLSMFHEYVARSLGLEVGPWEHASANAHIYVENPKWEPLLKESTSTKRVDGIRDLGAYPQTLNLFDRHNGHDARRAFDQDCARLMWGIDKALKSGVDAGASIFALLDGMAQRDTFSKSSVGAFSPFIHFVAVPMMLAHFYHKQGGNTRTAIDTLTDVNFENDWIIAGIKWLERRLK